MNFWEGRGKREEGNKGMKGITGLRDVGKNPITRLPNFLLPDYSILSSELL
jgi:hypothetical protein